MFKNNKAKRGIAALLTLAMTASLCCTFVPSAEAKTSLPAVETIKANAVNGEPFNILEIVPESTQGSIGYYVNGYEPWLAMTGAQETPATRTSYVNNTLPGLLNRTVTSDTVGVGFSINLCAKGTGDNAAYPLNHVGGYKEAYPWGNTEGYTKQLTLATPESQSVRGNMTEVGVYQGDYINGNAVLNVNSGSMVQVITDLLPEAGAGNGYWYDVSFSSLSHDGESAADNTLVYEGVKVDLVDGGKYYQELVEGTDYDVVGDDGKPYIKSTTGYGETIDESGDFYLPVEFSIENNGKFYNEVEVSLTPEYSGTDGLYLRVVGVVGSATFPGLETGETYYAAVTGAPYTANSEAGKRLWASTESGFTSGNPGYFDTNGYDYVGAQNGNCALTLSAEGKTLTLSTDIVYYTGGFTNNNWFAKYVMDWDADDSALPDIRVNTVAARDLTESQIRDADLVVLGYGFDPAGSNYKDVFCADYKPDAQDTIDSALLAVTLPTLVGVGEKDGKYALLDTLQKKPVIVDYGLAYGSGSEMTASKNSAIKSAATAIVSAARTARGYSSADTNRTFAANSIYVMDAFGVFSSMTADGETATEHVPGIPLVSSGTEIKDPNGGVSTYEARLFHATDVGAHSLIADPFYAVAEEIIYENFLREIRYGKDYTNIVSGEISQAATIRHIINTAYSRQVKNKDVVRVLDIEPRTGSATKGLGAEKKALIAGWLGIDVENLLVTTMSTSEFNAVQADLSETFDLLYIGDSTENFNVSDRQRISTDNNIINQIFGSNNYYYNYIRYNDQDMTYSSSPTSPINSESVTEYLSHRASAGWFWNPTDNNTTFGMRYTATGDRVQSGNDDSHVLSGLLDSNYRTLSFTKNLTGTGVYDVAEDYSLGSVTGWPTWNYNPASYTNSQTGETQTGVFHGLKRAASKTATYPQAGNKTIFLGSVFNTSASGVDSFRYSGNDLTSTASASIKKFAALGYPVIFADTLLKPPEFITGQKRDARVWLEGNVTGTVYSTVAEARANLYCEDSVLKISIDTVNAVTLLRWRISSAKLTLYKQIGTSPNTSVDTAVDSVTLVRGQYSHSFNLSDYELQELSIIKPGDTFYCTYEIQSYNNLLADWLNESWFTGNFFSIKAQKGYTECVKIRGDAEEMFVDSSSEMFSTINSMVGSFNVMSFAALNSKYVNFRRTLLPKLVNLPKPTLEFLGDTTGDVTTLAQDVYPTRYISITGNSLLAKNERYTLEYKFKIQNDADPYPDTTRYKMKLYLDGNGNGKFEPEEAITDLSARELTVYPGGTSSVGDRIENGKLLGSYGSDSASSDSCHYYYVYYQLPDTVQGLVPWKLEVIETYPDLNNTKTLTGGHDSETDYTRVAPTGEPETISILQINSLADKNLNLQQNIENGKIYGELLNGVSTDFRVSMTTIPANFDSTWSSEPVSYGTSTTGAATTTVQNSFTHDGEKYTRQAEGEAAATEFATLTELFMSYDMIIVGFSDAYRDLSQPVTEALAAFIKTKPVLMTHDVTSFYSMDERTLTSATGSDNINVTATAVPGENQNVPYTYTYSTYTRNTFLGIQNGWDETKSPDISEVVSLRTIKGWNTTLTYTGSGFFGLRDDYHVYKGFWGNPAATCNSYHTNLILRDLIGMDRYGVTSLKPLTGSDHKTVGLSTYAGLTGCIDRIYTDEDSALDAQRQSSELQTYIRSLPGFSDWSGGFVPSGSYINGVSYTYDKNGNVTSTTIEPLTTEQKSALDEVAGKGYSIAWKANTAKGQTVAETQGLTNGVLFRFLQNGDDNWFESLFTGGAAKDSYTIKYANSDRNRLGLTTAVTQVNKGQITTYPYDINTEAFSGGDSNGTSGYVDVAKNTQPVTLTHAQSYQLNLNYSADGSTSDMVVWYSLANDDSGVSVYQENDVVNNYYVYTVGNVTYTGSGHTTDDFDTRLAGAGADVVFEAKLFVNTMIAAYHAKLDTSKVSFTNKTGTTTDISDFFIVTDGNTILKTNSDGHVKDETRNIYFTASDNQAAAGETTNFRAEFYFGENFVEGLKLYDADTTEEVTNGALKNTYTYYIKLDELLAKIGDPSISDMATRGLNLKITPIYTGGGEPRDGTAVFAKLEFRQYKLFDLS